MDYIRDYAMYASIFGMFSMSWLAPWIAFMVGVHFIGLSSVFADPSLYVLVAVSILSLFVSPKLQVANSAITGIGSGIGPLKGFTGSMSFSPEEFCRLFISSVHHHRLPTSRFTSSTIA